MKKIILFMLLCPTILFGQTMQYRIAAVSEGLWVDPGKIEEVHNQVDQIIEKGFNVISIGTYKFMPSFFVDYENTPYPESQSLDPKQIAVNVEVMRENMRYAKSKGIEYIVSRSYSHYAPYNYWKAHQKELNPNNMFNHFLKRAHQNDIYNKTISAEKGVIPHQQWNENCFKKFFLYSTEKTLDILPELDGFLNAYAEAAWTLDLEKIKADDWVSWKECILYDKTDDNFIDYCNILYALLKQKRRGPVFFGIRDWYVKQDVLERLEIPKKDLVISVKYGGYDQPVINCPPWGKVLQEMGYSVVVDMLIFDAEHPHPLYWYSNDVINTIFSNIKVDRFSGLVYQDFMTKGNDSYNNPIRLLTQETVGRAIKGERLSNDEAVVFLEKYYKEGANDLLQSLKAVAIAQENFIKLMPAWFWQGDGLTPGGLQSYRFWMLQDNPDAVGGMAFIRRNTVGVPEYVNALLQGKNKFKSHEAKWKIENRLTPPEIMDIMLENADHAVAFALNVKKNAPQDASYLTDIVASAFIHRELVYRQIAFLNASLAFYESGYVFDDKYNKERKKNTTGIDKREECLTQLELIAYHDKILAELCCRYAPRRPERRGDNNFTFEKKIATIMGLQMKPIELDTMYLLQIESAIKSGS
ncbi:MAG: hypothetical protein GX963_14180 [Bacteroidales bacterium]|nr:hypothetical protein [Bacteroidales bacterium]